MTRVKRIVLDILKPHEPNPIEFATALASVCEGYEVRLIVEEIDERTESIVIEVLSTEIDYSLVSDKIVELGASIHSIDAVDVINEPEGG